LRMGNQTEEGWSSKQELEFQSAKRRYGGRNVTKSWHL
jgi:hypothetical protein